MAEYQLGFDGFVRLFFAMAIIICGYGYVIIGVFIRDTLSCIFNVVWAYRSQCFIFINGIHG